MLAMRQLSGSITPFGSDVDPLVNCRIARRSGSSAGRTSRSADSRAPSATSSSRRTTAARSGGGSRNGASSGSMTTTSASARSMRLMVCSTNSSIEPRRIGRGRATTAAPASQIACKAVTSARDVGPMIATCAPGSTPRACSAAAMVRASPWRRLHSTRSTFASPAAEPTKVMVPGPCAAASRRVGTDVTAPSTRGLARGLPARSRVWARTRDGGVRFVDARGQWTQCAS